MSLPMEIQSLIDERKDRLKYASLVRFVTIDANPDGTPSDSGLGSLMDTQNLMEYWGASLCGVTCSPRTLVHNSPNSKIAVVPIVGERPREWTEIKLDYTLFFRIAVEDKEKLDQFGHLMAQEIVKRKKEEKESTEDASLSLPRTDPGVD
jgi:hypothetical protein